MPRKKKAPVPSSSIPQRLRLNREELLELQLLSTSHRLLLETTKNLTLQATALLAKIDPKGQLSALEAQRLKASSEAAQSLAAYRQLLKATGDRLGCDLSTGCTIDPQTGEVTVLETAEKPNG